MSSAMRALLALSAALGLATFLPGGSQDRVEAGQPAMASGYKVLEPISHGRLVIFPVVTANVHDTRQFLTLDEGLTSGEVVVTEAGSIRPLIRRPGTRPAPQQDAEVNRLVLVNNSSRPLLLLAGEIVTGGKQDRVVGKDRIIPPNSDPVDLSVFCVERGRWEHKTASFGSMEAQMAQPSVRAKAMGDKDQSKVWDEVRKSNEHRVANAPAAARAEVGNTTSYAMVNDNAEMKRQVDEVAGALLSSHDRVLRQLRAQNAVGVVVAVNGRIIWADLFASTSLLEKYWAKLVRSYAAEALSAYGAKGSAGVKQAQAFLDDWDGNRQVVETEPGVFRHTEISGSGYRAFELTSLLPKTGFDIHLSKMVE
ncbi:MAG: ARPP-1 family domain-containing protein [Terriglobales bacterium]